MNQFNSSTPSNKEVELSLIDIVSFILESWKIILGFSLLGFGAAMLLINLIPKHYEVIAQIKMAQLIQINTSYKNMPISNLQVVNIEEPSELIARMRIPSSYSAQVIEACGLAGEEDSSWLLVKKISLSVPKGVGSTIDLRLRDTSAERAKNCAEAIFNLIRSYQVQQVGLYVEEAKRIVEIEKERLAQVKGFSKITSKQEGVSATEAYLTSRDEIRYLIERISTIHNTIIANESRITRLQAPIYVKRESAYPQKTTILLTGFFGSGFLGFLFALIRKFYRSYYRLPANR